MFRWRKILGRIQAHYGGAGRPALPHCTAKSSFEPHVAAAVFSEMIHEENVTLLIGYELTSVIKTKRGQLISAELERSAGASQDQPKFALSARVFVDATYEGDLLAAAGVSHTVGRESAAHYAEPVAGRRPLVDGACYGFHTAVDPFTTTGAPLPTVWASPLAKVGGADQKVMSYNYRLCLTNSTSLKRRAEITEPPGYDPSFFELHRRYFRAAPPSALTPTVLKIYTVAVIPENEGGGVKTDVNAAVSPVSTNLVGGSWGYPNGSRAERAAIIAAHQRYTRGLLWFLKTDPSVPASLRAEMASWAWCRVSAPHPLAAATMCSFCCRAPAPYAARAHLHRMSLSTTTTSRPNCTSAKAGACWGKLWSHGMMPSTALAGAASNRSGWPTTLSIVTRSKLSPSRRRAVLQEVRTGVPQ